MAVGVRRRIVHAVAALPPLRPHQASQVQALSASVDGGQHGKPGQGGPPVPGDVEFAGVLSGIRGLALRPPHSYSKRARGSCFLLECWCLHVRAWPGKTCMAELWI